MFLFIVPGLWNKKKNSALQIEIQKKVKMLISSEVDIVKPMEPQTFWLFKMKLSSGSLKMN